MRPLLFSSNINSLLLSKWATCDNREMVWKDTESVFQRRFSWTSLLSDRKLPNYFREWPNGCLHYTKVWHKTYPICDPPHIGAAQILTVPEITPPQSSSCINKVLSSLISVAMQNLSAMVWTQPQICWFRFKSMLISKTNLFECLCIYRKSTIDTTKNMVIQGARRFDCPQRKAVPHSQFC